MKGHLAAAGLAVAMVVGCRSAPVREAAQPVVFEGTSYDAVWEATLATLQQRFPIHTAYRKGGEILTRFEITYGYFEFWRDLSTSARDRWENTLQTIRRRARARVSRLGSGKVALRLTVEKERRDRARQGARFSFSTSLSIFDPRVNALDRALRDPTAEEWTPLGRDRALEAELIEEIRNRLAAGRPFIGT